LDYSEAWNAWQYKIDDEDKYLIYIFFSFETIYAFLPTMGHDICNCTPLNQIKTLRVKQFNICNFLYIGYISLEIDVYCYVFCHCNIFHSDNLAIIINKIALQIYCINNIYSYFDSHYTILFKKQHAILFKIKSLIVLLLKLYSCVILPHWSLIDMISIRTMNQE